ncbi:MAG: VWA domain-containing protein [Bdellovibrio sp.]|nr:VWA domain-containing protein [Bdellovibrio sp.]
MKFFTKKIIFASLAAAFVATGCSDKSPQLVPASTVNKETVSEKPQDLVMFNPKVDILFVIDNSGSMQDAQTNLSRNARLFSDAITKMSVLDYHIGVTSTDMNDCQRGCGNLIGFPYFVDKNTANGASALANNMLIGTDGSSIEMMFSPVVNALTTSLNNPSNVGFYRADAYLAIILITDAEEQSRLSPADLLNFLIQKKGDASKVLAYGVIRKLAEERTCYDMGETLSDKLETFLSTVVNADKKQNNVLSLCASDYGIKLAQFAADIVKRSSGTIRLQRIPNVKTIKVTYGVQVIPNDPKTGWVFEVSTNSIILSADIKFIDQGPNVGLSVDFDVIETK